MFDSAGNILGTTLTGGASGDGTVFELSPMPNGEWKEKVVVNFDGSNGDQPHSALTADSLGNLYGTTYQGGQSGAGVVYELSLQSDGKWTESLVHQFAPCTATACPDGIGPLGGVIVDGSGDLYGTATLGGAAAEFCNPGMPGFHEGCGIVFKLSHEASGAWSYNIIHRFPGETEGAFLSDDRLALDSNGIIYGTSVSAGDVNANGVCPDALPEIAGCGVVFELIP